jgi:hypothetical protein
MLIQYPGIRLQAQTQPLLLLLSTQTNVYSRQPSRLQSMPTLWLVDLLEPMLLSNKSLSSMYDRMLYASGYRLPPCWMDWISVYWENKSSSANHSALGVALVLKLDDT